MNKFKQEWDVDFITHGRTQSVASWPPQDTENQPVLQQISDSLPLTSQDSKTTVSL